VKEEFTTHTDPFILEALRNHLSPLDKTRLNNWSRSYYTLEGHMDSIRAYDKPLLAEPTDDEWTSVKEGSTNYFRTLPKVKAFSARTDFDSVRFRQSTSAGYGYLDTTSPRPTHKGLFNGHNHRKAKRIASAIVEACKTEYAKGTFDQFIEYLPEDSTPDVAFTRTQLSELPTTKVRNVFGEAFHYVILEGLFAQPLINQFMQMDTFYYIGQDPLSGVPDMINRLSDDGNPYYITLDWSKFDSSVQPYEIELAFDLLESMIEFPDLETLLIFKYVKRLFISRKVAAPDGNVFVRTGGVPSGSYFTHIVDSIINWNRIKYLFKRQKIDINFIRTHGDDSIIQTFSSFDSLLPLVSEASQLGWILRAEKIALVQDKSRIEFLGRSVSFGVNYRDPIKVFRLLVYTEYPVQDPQISIARLKSINIDSGLTLPYVSQIYQFLKLKYGDLNVPLPSKFKQFRHDNDFESYAPISI